MDWSWRCPRAFESCWKPCLLVAVVVVEEENTDVSITSPSAPSDAASRKSCRLGHNVGISTVSSVSIVPSGLFVGQGTDGEMQAGGKETVK